MDPREEYALLETRRQFFGRAAAGIGTAAVASLLNPGLFAAQGQPDGEHRGEPGVMKRPHHKPTAKRMIYLCMAGAPSHPPSTPRDDTYRAVSVITGLLGQRP